MTKKKKIVWNKSHGKIIPSKFLKERRDQEAKDLPDNNTKESDFKKKFTEAIRKAAKI